MDVRLTPEKNHRGNSPFIIGRDLMAHLGLKLIQQTLRAPVMTIKEELHGDSRHEIALELWQEHSRKQFSNIICRIEERSGTITGRRNFERVLAQYNKKLTSTNYIAR